MKRDHRGKVWGLAALLLAACQGSGAVARLPDAPSAEIPIKRVVLYQNGVGYFERQGSIDGDVLSLQIRPSQINDLLKSLTVIDTGNGRAVSISLPLEKSGDRVLSEIPEQVRNARGLLEVLSVFRGARVEVEGRYGSATGRVVGVENLESKKGEEVVSEWRVTLRTDDGELQVFPIADLRSVVILDRTLAVGLDESLDVSLNEGDWKPITLSIRLAGDSSHELRASYIVEMPRWKPAYRIVLDEKSPLLQGWAVVDNVSGEHWRDVKLSLVAGAPLSFIYDLHSSQYTERVDMSPRGRQVAAAPPVEQGGTLEMVEEAAMEAPGDDAAEDEDYDEAEAEKGYPGKRAKKSMSVGSGAGRAAMRSMAPPAPKPAPMSEALELQAAPQVEVQQMGSLFRYDIADPVTVPDRSSTLVAIVNQRVKAQEVAFFRPEEPGDPLGEHPYSAIKFTNDTPLTLEKGPVTLYSKGTFVGEGFLDRVEPGATHFVSYAIDGKVSLDSDYATKEEGGKLLRISDGLIVSEVLRIEITTFELKNLHDEPITAFVKVERRSDWDLRNKPAGTVETPTALLLPVEVPKRGKAKLPVEWARSTTRNVGIDTSLGLTVLKVYLEGGKVPPEAAQTLKQVLELQSKLQDVRTESARLERLRNDLGRDQDRVRANLNTLRKTTGNQALQAQLAKKLALQEEELGKLSGKLVQLSEQQAELQAQMKALIKTVSLTGQP